MVNIRKLVALPVKNLRQIAKLRNISQNLSKKDIIYALICSELIINEQKYIIDSNNVNKIRLQVFDISSYINKTRRGDIRKILYDIGKMQKVDEKLKKKLLDKLDSISVEWKVVQKRVVSDLRDENYASIDDIEYILVDIDNYYAAILTSSLFDKGYQRCQSYQR